MKLITIGVNPNNRVVIDQKFKTVSGYHAEIIVRDDGSIYIIDKSSTNGTTVKDRRISAEVEVSVNRGDKITFAGVVDLDWNKIPIVSTPGIGWKLYSIGTDFKNRVKINDDSNVISRFHATLKIDPKGKIYINDHSKNGTFVNGNRIPSDQDFLVKRKDSIMFSNIQSLDWSLILHHVKPKVYLAPIAAVLFIGLGLFGFYNHWFIFNPKPVSPDPKPNIYIVPKHDINSSGIVHFNKMTPENIFKKYQSSVVMVVHSYKIVADLVSGEQIDLKKGTAFATAFFVDTKGTMITNRHVVMPWESQLEEAKNNLKKYCLKNSISYSDNVNNVKGETNFIGIALNNTDISIPLNGSDYIECSVINRFTDNEENDIGLLRTKNRSLPNRTIQTVEIRNVLEYKRDDYNEGKKIFIIGYPLGINTFNKSGTKEVQVKSTCQDGIINKSPDVFKFGVNAQMTHGASGSPVFNENGQFIGVFNSGFDETQGLNYAILAKHAKKLYNDAN